MQLCSRPRPFVRDGVPAAVIAQRLTVAALDRMLVLVAQDAARVSVDGPRALADLAPVLLDDARHAAAQLDWSERQSVGAVVVAASRKLAGKVAERRDTIRRRPAPRCQQGDERAKPDAENEPGGAIAVELAPRERSELVAAHDAAHRYRRRADGRDAAAKGAHCASSGLGRTPPRSAGGVLRGSRPSRSAV